MRGDVVVPALVFRDRQGRLDIPLIRRYAERATATWIDRFILSGSTTGGHDLTVADRTAILDVWTKLADRSRLLACCWCEQDVAAAMQREVRPLVVMQGLGSHQQALDFLSLLPSGSYVYSHPMYTPTVLDEPLARLAMKSAVLPPGAKIAKLSLAAITAVRHTTGPQFLLWDGSSRRIKASLDAGASGVVATPLAALPAPFPQRSANDVQKAVNPIQALLDDLPTRQSRTDLLTALAAEGDSTQRW